MQWLQIVKTLQDDRLWRERLGEEFAGKSCYLADIITFDRRARAHADQPAIVAPNVFLEATKEAGHFDTACAAVGMHFIQNEVAHLLVHVLNGGVRLHNEELLILRPRTVQGG